MENFIEIPFTLEEGATPPIYASDLAAGADVCAYIPKAFALSPGCSACIPTGIRVEIPPHMEIQLRPRSGLALKHQITLLNSPGTIDADYRGEIKVILINHGTETFMIEPNMRIAQMIIAPVFRASFVREKSLSETQRGENGFGHTGIYSFQIPPIHQ
jgi:dUTP pyrophosphatase